MYLFNRLRSKEALRQKYRRQIQAHIDSHHIPAVVMHHVGKVLANARRSMPNAVPNLTTFANATYRAKENAKKRVARTRTPPTRTRNQDPLGHIHTQWHMARAPSVPHSPGYTGYRAPSVW